MSDLKAHWDKVYAERGADGVSWFQAEPSLSLSLLGRCALSAGDRVVDVGGGASVLVDRLLDQGLKAEVLDLSAEALKLSRARLGPRAAEVLWHLADATLWQPEAQAYRLWHDRAVFHFLTDSAQRQAYLARLRQGLKPGGWLILAAFSPDGPEKCSGLPVQRWDRDGLLNELGAGFELKGEETESHRTPWDSVQSFSYWLLKKLG